MDKPWMIPIMAVVFVPAALLVVAVSAAVFTELFDWIEDRLRRRRK